MLRKTGPARLSKNWTNPESTTPLMLVRLHNICVSLFRGYRGCIGAYLWASSTFRPTPSGRVTLCNTCHKLNKSLAWCALGSSAKKHSGAELCSILNRAIREDDPHAMIHAAVFAYAMNMQIVHKRNPEPWIKNLFPKFYPCVKITKNMFCATVPWICHKWF